MGVEFYIKIQKGKITLIESLYIKPSVKILVILPLRGFY